MTTAEGKIVKELTEPLVFVVDDDASMRKALCNLIRSAGLRVVAFASAE
jgi:FixJ family two-component response regulator